jgi:hypothetical protein
LKVSLKKLLALIKLILMRVFHLILNRVLTEYSQRIIQIQTHLFLVETNDKV